MEPEPLQETDVDGVAGRTGANSTVATAHETAEQDFASLVATLESQQSELIALREQLSLRDEAFNSTTTQFMITRNTGDDRVIEYCNRAFAENMGFRHHDLLGKSVRVLVPDVWETPGYQKVLQDIHAGKILKIESQLQRKDGTSFMIGVTIVPIRWNEQGQATHSFAVSADITERRAMEQHQRELQEQLVAEMKQRERILLELRLAQKLESVGRLAAGVAHEINTPIQYVGDSLHFLRSVFDDLIRLVDDCRAALDEQEITAEMTALKQRLLDAAQSVDLPFLRDEAPKAFARTFDGVDRVAGIVRAMKEFSHPDATEFSTADINHALHSTLTVATNEYKYIATVQTEFDPDLPPVKCNIGELNQVFLNLIVNAAHAIHDADRDVSQGKIRIATMRAGDDVEITVTDNGCGIPQEHLDKIYDPFFTTKEVGRGTGQGLAITHSIIVDKHGGSVEVISEPGVGTTFKISLPITGRNKEAPG